MEDIKKWNRQHAWLMSIAALWALLTEYAWMLSLWAVISFSYWIWLNRETLAQFRPWGGYANWATAGRLLLLVALSIAYPWLTHTEFFILIWLPIGLDAVDGFLARRFQQSSEFGQYFDMEADAFYVLLLTILLYQSGKVGTWVLVPGILRYVYVIVISLIGWQDRELQGSFLAKVIGGGFFVILPWPFIIPEPLGAYVLAGMTILLFWSFGVSFYELYQVGKKNSND
jgi:phosphatidylglycerophosphate synthase